MSVLRISNFYTCINHKVHREFEIDNLLEINIKDFSLAYLWQKVNVSSHMISSYFDDCKEGNKDVKKWNIGNKLP